MLSKSKKKIFKKYKKWNLLFTAPHDVDWDAAAKKLEEIEKLLDTGYAEIVNIANEENSTVALDMERILNETKVNSEVILSPFWNGIVSHNLTATEAREILDEFVGVMAQGFVDVIETSEVLTAATHRHIIYVIVHVSNAYELAELELLEILGAEDNHLKISEVQTKLTSILNP